MVALGSSGEDVVGGLGPRGGDGMGWDGLGCWVELS